MHSGSRSLWAAPYFALSTAAPSNAVKGLLTGGRLGPALAAPTDASSVTAAKADEIWPNLEWGHIGDSFSEAAWPGAPLTLRQGVCLASMRESSGIPEAFPGFLAERHASVLR